MLQVKEKQLINMKEDVTNGCNPLLGTASDTNMAEIMDADHFVYTLYFGSTEGNGAYYSRIYGYTAYTFKNVFNYIEDNDIFWCTADIGWITGHSYILY
jgi:acetyl-CoA synthetase